MKTIISFLRKSLLAAGLIAPGWCEPTRTAPQMPARRFCLFFAGLLGGVGICGAQFWPFMRTLGGEGRLIAMYLIAAALVWTYSTEKTLEVPTPVPG